MKSCAKHRHCHHVRPADMDETKDHIMAAGRELLLAAHGALSFCKEYVENSIPESSRPNLLCFFQKAIAVADDLSKGLASVSDIKRAASGFAKPILTAIEREMRGEADEAAHKKAPARKPVRAKHSSRSRARAR
ncbi:MAG: hypothetical protein V2A66_02735 [Pseudomonadota bacterium]